MGLEHELTTFRRELPGLLADPANHGRFVLIHGDEVAGVWDTCEKGLEAGYERFGLKTFLVKEITEHEKVRYYSAPSPMPLIEDNITAEGAVITVLLGVSQSRETVLRRAGFPVPSPVPLRLLIDSGSFATGVPFDALRSLEIQAFNQVPVGTLSTPKDEPHVADLFDVSLQLVSGLTVRTIPSVHVIAGAGYDLHDRLNGILGRDVLDRCHFIYLGPERRFQLGF